MTAAAVAPDPAAPSSPSVTGSLSGPFARPEPRRDRAGWVVLGLLALVGIGLYFMTRLGARPQLVDAPPDLAMETAAADLALVIIEQPDRGGPDLAIAAAPPDLAVPKKKRHREDDDDLPTTVFGAEPAKPAP